MRYIGEKCPVCQKEFTADDDIVVCPECGTPHHRDCYMLENRCANEELHAAGEKWTRKPKAARYRVCPKCSFPNRITDTVCQRCGEEISSAAEQSVENSNGTNGEKWRETFPMPDAEDLMNPIKYLGLDPEEDMGGATMKEMSDFVGPSNIYYIPKFKKMKDEGVRPTFNLFSLLFPSLFFANRKMWGWAILAASLGIIFNLPANLLMYDKGLPSEIISFLKQNKSVIELMSEIFVAADIVVRIIFGLFSNWFYYRFSLNSLKKIKKNNRPVEDIKAVGGVKPLNMVLITLIKYGIGLIVVTALCTGFEMMTTIKDFSDLCIR